MDAILALTRPRQIAVVEDAAHAFPAFYRGQMIGTIGDLTAFSFYATKTLATGDGGMLTTNNPEYAQRCALMALHGMSRDAWKRYTAEGSWFYEIVDAGFKYNMTDWLLPLGCSSLPGVSGCWNAAAALRRAIPRRLAGGLNWRHHLIRRMCSTPGICIRSGCIWTN